MTHQILSFIHMYLAATLHCWVSTITFQPKWQQWALLPQISTFVAIVSIWGLHHTFPYFNHLVQWASYRPNLQLWQCQYNFDILWIFVHIKLHRRLVMYLSSWEWDIWDNRLITIFASDLDLILASHLQQYNFNVVNLFHIWKPLAHISIWR